MLYNFSFTLSMVGENGWTESLSQRKMKKGSQSLFQRVIGCWHLVALRNIATKHVQQQCTAPPSHAFTSQFRCAPVTHACILFWWPIMALYMLNFCWYLDRMKSWRERYRSGLVSLHILPNWSWRKRILFISFEDLYKWSCGSLA